MPTKIEWANEVWNPVVGCTPASAGCDHCYAKRIFERNLSFHDHKFENPTTYPNRLDTPFHWKSPRRVFVNSMSDLFHPDVQFEFISKVINVAFLNPKLTFMILTKRPSRMLDFFKWVGKSVNLDVAPAPANVWIGVSAENQATVDERIPILLQVPAAVRFVSVEPMLGPVELRKVKGDHVNFNVLEKSRFDYANNGFGVGAPMSEGIDWVICGGESGSGARFMHPDWVRKLRDQCTANHVPFFFKGWAGFKYEAANNAVFKDTHEQVPVDAQPMTRKFIGKKRAGRLLDGREWNQIPNESLLDRSRGLAGLTQNAREVK